MKFALVFLISIFVLSSCQRPADNSVLVATASSFRPALLQVLPSLEQSCQTSIRVTSGSTGGLISQIINGAPFDLLISADWQLSQKLTARPVQFDPPFARSPLAFWWPKGTGTKTPIAIANPDIAPFGRAAMQVMGKQIDDLVLGASAAQAFVFVDAGAANSGYVPLSLLLAAQIPSEQYQLVAKFDHQPILLHLVRLQDRSLANCIAEQLAGPQVMDQLLQLGYRAL